MGGWGGPGAGRRSFQTQGVHWALSPPSQSHDLEGHGVSLSSLLYSRSYFLSLPEKPHSGGKGETLDEVLEN